MDHTTPTRTAPPTSSAPPLSPPFTSVPASEAGLDTHGPASPGFGGTQGLDDPASFSPSRNRPGAAQDTARDSLDHPSSFFTPTKSTTPR